MNNYNVVKLSEVLENVEEITNEYNSKQKYYEDDKTYFQIFHDDPEGIIKSASKSYKYSSDEITGDLVLDLGHKKIDLSKYTKEDYKNLSDELSHELAAKQIINIIKTDPELSDLNNRFKSNDVWLDTDRGYASISYNGENDKISTGELLFSIESNGDSSDSLNSNGFKYMSWSNNEGVYHSSLKSGLESTESYLRFLDEEKLLELESLDEKPKRRHKI